MKRWPTTRQREVWALLANGKCGKDVAHELGLSLGSVFCHRRALYDNLEVHTVADATHMAIRFGIVPLRFMEVEVPPANKNRRPHDGRL